MNQDALTAPVLEALLQAPSLAILAVDKQGSVILWSPSATRMFGWTESEVLGHFLPIVPEEQREGVYERIESALEGEIISALDVRRLRKDGSLMDVSLWTAPLRDSDGKFIGVLGLYADITARKQAGAELSRVLGAVSDCIYSGEFESDGRFYYHYYSAAAERILGRPPLFFLAGPERWLNAVYPEDRPRLAQAFNRLRSGESTSEEEEYRIILPDGSIRWVRDNAVMSSGVKGHRFVNGVVSDITARKQGEAALQQAKTELQGVLAAVSDYIWSGQIDSKGRFTYRYNSPSVERILGRPATFFRAGRGRWLSIVHPEDRPRAARAADRLLTGQSTCEDDEYRIVLPDGAIRWVRNSITISQSPDGLRCLNGVVTDITARKQGEEALRESEARFRALIDNAPTAASISRDGITIYANKKYLEMFGFQNADELIGRPIGDQWSPEWRPIIQERARQRWLGEPLPSDYEGIAQRKDGSVFPVQVSVARIDLPDGPANLGFLTDITERKQAEEALRESEARFRGMFTGAPTGIILASPEGRFLEVNPALCKFLGYSEQELLGKTGQELTHPDDRERTAAIRRQIWERKEPSVRTYEKRYVRKDGQVVWVEVSITLIRDATGTANYSIAYVVDITGSHRAGGSEESGLGRGKRRRGRRVANQERRVGEEGTS